MNSVAVGRPGLADWANILVVTLKTVSLSCFSIE
jgi:hypothetical protein